MVTSNNPEFLFPNHWWDRTRAISKNGWGFPCLLLRFSAFYWRNQARLCIRVSWRSTDKIRICPRIKTHLSFPPSYLKHLVTSAELFHCCTPRCFFGAALTQSRVCLFIFPISDLAGLIKRQGSLSEKSSLWFFSVINASLRANVSMRSATLRQLAIICAPSLISP